MGLQSFFTELASSSFTDAVGNYIVSNDWIIMHNNMNVQESGRIIPTLA
jgi:hypothetical protein